MSLVSGKSFKPICWSCRAMILQASPAAKRDLSSSRRLQRALPTFKPASSPELDELLSEVRFKYFLPAYLNRTQRKLVRSEKRRTMLENDPIYASFGGEEIQLRPIGATDGLPAKKTFLEVISRFKRKEDWQNNLAPLLEGFNNSNTKPHEKWLIRMVAAAEEAGALNVVVNCLAQVEKNGLSLRMTSIRKRILLGLRRTAKAQSWSEATKTLRTVEHVLNYMEHPEHCGSRRISEQDPRAEPYIIAVPCELACRVAAQNAGVMVDRIEKYSTRLLAGLAQQQTALTVEEPWRAPDGIEKPIQFVRALQSLDLTVSEFIPVRNALMLALEARTQSWTADESAFAAQIQKQIEKKLNLAESEAKKLQSRADLSKFPTPGLDEWAQERIVRR